MRLIDVKELERQTKEAFKESPVVMGILLRWMRKQPTIDAVPVVRCKDCKKAENREHEVFCSLIGAFMGNDDFCSYGERKDGAT